MNIDLNSDLGESFGAWRMGDDEAMLNIVSSANLACGFHAGDPADLLKILQASAKRGVVVGAHVSYPDLVGFGRRAMDMASGDLRAALIYQIGALQGLAKAAGTRVCYVKPHGALYNRIAHDRRQAEDVIAAILAIDAHLPLVVLAGSPLVQWARDAGLIAVSEAFADRGYRVDGSLVPRSEPGALFHEPDEVAYRMLRLVQQGSVLASDGTEVRIEADSICVHGDTPDAVSIAQRVRERLEAAGVAIHAFAGQMPSAKKWEN